MFSGVYNVEWSIQRQNHASPLLMTKRLPMIAFHSYCWDLPRSWSGNFQKMRVADTTQGGG